MNQSGQLTVDFLFAIVLAFGLFTVFFALTFTLSVVEVTQYVAFSSSRAQVASNLTRAAQRAAARDKFLQLTNSAEIGNLYKNGWFTVSDPIIRQGLGRNDTFAKEFSRSTGEPFLKVFTGVSIPFQAPLLKVKVPFIGKNQDDDAGLFKTHLNAILIRESSQEECYDYWEERRGALSQLPSGDSKFYVPSSYARMEDNGC